MAKKAVLTVDEVLAEIRVTPNDKGKMVLAKFSKSKFDALMRAMLNDPEFTTKKAIVKSGELSEVTDIAVSKGFRKFVKGIIEGFGVDKAESEKVMSPNFTVDNVDGLYEFFATALYEYIDAGNKFDLIPKEDFRGSVSLKSKPDTTTTSKVYQPKTREYLGEYSLTKKAHKVLSTKSPCPKYLKKRIKKG